MKIIIIEEIVWQQLNSRINAIADYLEKQEDKSYDDLWLNNHEVCQYLHVSKKHYGGCGIMATWPIQKSMDNISKPLEHIKDMLNANAVKTSDEYVKELMKKGKSYIEKGRKLKSGKQ